MRTEEAILEATLRLLATRGIHGMSLDLLSDEVGVAKSSILWHFGSKEELLLRVQKLIEKNKKLHDKENIGDVYHFGKNAVDFKAQEAVSKNGDRIQLSKKEAMLLKLLIENKNEVVPGKRYCKPFGAITYTPPPARLIISS